LLSAFSFLKQSASHPLQTHLQYYLEGSCFYGIIQKPSDLLANRELFLTDFPTDQKMRSEDFAVMAGDVPGVK